MADKGKKDGPGGAEALARFKQYDYKAVRVLPREHAARRRLAAPRPALRSHALTPGTAARRTRRWCSRRTRGRATRKSRTAPPRRCGARSTRKALATVCSSPNLARRVTPSGEPAPPHNEQPSAWELLSAPPAFELSSKGGRLGCLRGLERRPNPRRGATRGAAGRLRGPGLALRHAALTLTRVCSARAAGAPRRALTTTPGH